MRVRISKENILSKKLPIYNVDTIYRLKKSGHTAMIEKNPSDSDIEFLELLFKGVYPTFFGGKTSASIRTPKTVKEFFDLDQMSNNYYMPVTYKDISNKKKAEYIDNIGQSYKKFYTSTDKSNINSVRAVLVDIDCHTDEDLPLPEEIDHLARSINYMADQEGLAPTAVINSGRGVQLIYILEEPVYRNKHVIDKMLRTFHRTLTTRLNEDILPHIESPTEAIPQLKCDKQINPINQKMRCPGTLNYQSGSYAHVVILNKHNLFNMTNFLGENLGDYEEHSERIKELRKLKKKQKAKKGRKNTNSKNNMGIYCTRRIEAIKKAINYASEKKGTGFRNNGYFSLIWQMLGSLEISNYRYTRLEDIASEIYDFDSTLKIPYFSSFYEALKLVRSTARTRNNSNKKNLTNVAIENYCVALSIAHEDGIDLDIFYKPIQAQIRLEKKIAREEEEEHLLKNISKAILTNRTIVAISEDFKKARGTIYNKLRTIAEKLGIRQSKKSLKGLFKKIYRALIRELNSTTSPTKDLAPLLLDILKDLEEQWNRPVDLISDPAPKPLL